jgi:hypothetical protein
MLFTIVATWLNDFEINKVQCYFRIWIFALVIGYLVASSLLSQEEDI